MRTLLLTMAACLAACGQTKKFDVPITLDQNAAMPSGTRSLKDYNRYYAKTNHGWVGIFDSTAKGGGKAQLTTEDKLPMVLDGGCDIVNFTFDDEMKLVSAFCNGDA